MEAEEAAAQGESTVLEEVVDPDYQPTSSDVNEYAAFLGIDPEAEPQLMWIAEQVRASTTAA